MESILNLLLLRGKFLTTKAAQTLHEAIKKCLHYKQEIIVNYNSATQVIYPFENMLDSINYQSSHYRAEGNHCAIGQEHTYNVYEFLTNENIEEAHNLKQFITNKESVQSLEKASRILNRLLTKQHTTTVYQLLEQQEKENEIKVVNDSRIIENLHAILKSQEFLFKNVSKLVTILEKHDVLRKSPKLEQIKQKVTACTDILSSTSPTQQFSNIVNQLIEEEITRCRFRNGETKTSAEISLKTPQPIGLEAALENPNLQCADKKPKDQKNIKKIKKKEEKTTINLGNFRNRSMRKNRVELEVKSNMQGLIKRSASDPLIREKQNIHDKDNFDRNIKKKLKQTQIKDKQSNTKLPKAKIDENINQNKIEDKKSNTEFPKTGSNYPKTNKFVQSAPESHQVVKFNTSESKLVPDLCKTLQMDIEDLRKMMEVNEEHFKKFENSLWHLSTTVKFLSLKEDYRNMCKCAFYNKRQFITTELRISKKNNAMAELEAMKKFVDMSNTMFAIVERKLLFQQVQQELIESGQLPTSEENLIGDWVNQQNKTKQLPSKNYLAIVLPQKNEPNQNKKKIADPKIKEMPETIQALNIVDNKLEEITNLSTSGRQALVVIPDSTQKLLIGSSELTPIRNNINSNTHSVKKNAKVQPKTSKSTESNEKHKLSRNNQETNTIINSIRLEKTLCSYIDKNNANSENEVKKEDKLIKTTDSLKEENKLQPQKEMSSPNSSKIQQTGSTIEKTEAEIPLAKIETQATIKIDTTAQNEKADVSTKEVGSKPITEKTELELFSATDTSKPTKKIETISVITENKPKLDTENIKLSTEKIEAKSSIEKIEMKPIVDKLKDKSTTEKIETTLMTEKVVANETTNVDMKSVENKSEPKLSIDKTELEAKSENKDLKFPVDKMIPQPVIGIVEPGFLHTFPVPEPVISKDKKNSNELTDNKTDQPPVQNNNNNMLQDFSRKNIEQKTFSYFNYKQSPTKNNWRKIVNNITSVEKIKTYGDSQKTNKVVQKYTTKNVVTNEINNRTNEKNVMSEILKKYTSARPYYYLNNDRVSKFAKEEIRLDKTIASKISENVTQKPKSNLVTEKPKTDSTQASIETPKEVLHDLNSDAEKPIISVQPTVSHSQSLPKQNINQVINRTNKSVSLSEIKNEEKRIDVNNKAFSDLETTIKNVQIFIEKSSYRKGCKTTTHNRTRKIDEPVKKSMSTKHLTTPTDKPEETKNTKYTISYQGPTKHIQERQRLLQQIKKQANKLSLPTNKTFLKKGKQVSAEKKISVTDQKKESTVIKTGKQEQMRRTTKNAMRRQQVVTIFPKLAKTNEEKKKVEVSLVETDEVKAAKLDNQNKKKTTYVCGIRKINVSNNVKNKTSKELSKQLSEQIHCVEWKMQDDAEIVHILER